METPISERPYFPAASGICWASVIAGAVVSLAITIVLLWFGAALGLTLTSPWNDSGVSATTFKIGTGLFLVVVAMISSALGGHIAGRLRNGWDSSVHANEIYFRDTAHGFVTWATATFVGAVLLASAAAGIARTTSGGLAAGAASATASRASSGPMDIYVDQLLRPGPGAAASNTTSPNDSRAELSRLLTASFRSGKDMSLDDKTYVAQVVAKNTGMSQDEAQKRVDQTIVTAKSNLDAARKAAMQLAYWIVASLLIGAFSASLAATEAGAFLDRNWSTV
ncbi:hypothetical protein [Afipia felis]|uniref:Transmembrane protein n=2 Tax=Afipia felis TaxID=1035 RepID=A0A380W4F0_AFIFE|nr:hypothetical protein [Afipia felis]EKS30264.1 hypothetical protein HMPREF9697_02792 [Afipia felis ATCC 53690]SUU75009.1 Uncharacterised protein [Afipia felis]SUU83075.1 Uncharacterised protein [Afipia felis]